MSFCFQVNDLQGCLKGLHPSLVLQKGPEKNANKLKLVVQTSLCLFAQVGVIVNQCDTSFRRVDSFFRQDYSDRPQCSPVPGGRFVGADCVLLTHQLTTLQRARELVLYKHQLTDVEILVRARAFAHVGASSVRGNLVLSCLSATGSHLSPFQTFTKCRNGEVKRKFWKTNLTALESKLICSSSFKSLTNWIPLPITLSLGRKTCCRRKSEAGV